MKIKQPSCFASYQRAVALPSAGSDSCSARALSPASSGTYYSLGPHCVSSQMWILLECLPPPPPPPPPAPPVSHCPANTAVPRQGSPCLVPSSVGIASLPWTFPRGEGWEGGWVLLRVPGPSSSPGPAQCRPAEGREEDVQTRGSEHSFIASSLRAAG